MTTYKTAAEIKGLIQESGSNLVEITTEVHSSLFFQAIDKQKEVLSKSLFNKEGADIQNLVMVGASNKHEHVTVKVKVQISDELISSLEEKEAEEREILGNAIKVDQPMTIQELSELEGTEFALQVDGSFLSRNKQIQEGFASDFISKDFKLTGINLVLLTQKLDSTKFLMKASIPTLQEQVEKHLEQEQAVKAFYEGLETDGFTRLHSPLTESDLEEISEGSAHQNEEGYHFKHLVEVQYDTLKDNDEYYMDEILADLVFTGGEDCIEDLTDEPVGFNPITKSVILRVTGFISFED